MVSSLVGRDAELRFGDALLADAIAARGHVLLIAGDAGIGKTTVAREIARRGEDAGALVRWGACFEGASLLPFGVWIDCLRHPPSDAGATITARLDGDDAVEHAEHADADAARRQRLRLFRDVVDWLRATASVRPQVLILEDLHWADRGSLELLAAVTGAAPAMPLLLVGTYRHEELDPAAASLEALAGGIERITLGGLGEHDVAAVLAGVLGRPPAVDDVRRVLRQTGGNPLFVTQVARLPGEPGAKLPAPLREVLARRFARCSTRCDDVLAAASVLGLEFDVDLVAELLGEPNADVADALAEAAEAHIASPDPGVAGRWRFVHDLIRTVRYELLSSAARQRLHRRAAELLADRPGGTSPVVLAHHAALAGFDPDDVRPATYHIDAAQEAIRRMAWIEAAELADRALRSAPAGTAGDLVRAEAWLALGDARLRRGAAPAAAEAFTAAAEIARARADPELVARAALGFAAGLGGFEVQLFDDRQVELLEESARTLAEDSPLRPLVLARLSVALSFRGSDEQRLRLADEAIDLARRTGDERALAAALAARCDAVAGPDHVADRIAAATEIVGLAQRTGDLAVELLGRRLLVVALLEQRDMSGVDVEIAAYQRASDRLGDPFYGWYALLWRAMQAHADGRLDEAASMADEAAESGSSAGSRNAVLLRGVLTAYLHLDRGEAEQAIGCWRAAIDEFPSIGELASAFPAYLASRTGRLDEARATLARHGAGVLDRPPDQEWLADLALVTAAASRLDDRQLARRAYELLAPYEGIGVFEGIAAVDLGVTDRFLALAAGCCGDAAARRHAEAALAGAAGAGRLVVAHTRADCARALGAVDDAAAREWAAELARAAADDYDSLGLGVLAAEARSLLAPETANAPASGTASLVREGNTWACSFDGRTVRVAHAKGLADLAVLLSRPDRQVHVRELEGVADVAGAPLSDQPALDDEAIRRYRQRLRDLEVELDEADRRADAGRAARLAAERDALVEHLTGAFGLGGRRRSAGSDADERLRKAVSARVKAAVGRIDAVHPSLGRHLRNSVYTGYWCSYAPERSVEWTIAT